MRNIKVALIVAASIGLTASLVFAARSSDAIWNASAVSAKRAKQNEAKAPVWQIVGTRTGMPYGISGPKEYIGQTFRTSHWLPYGARDIQLIYPGFNTPYGLPLASMPQSSFYAKNCTPVDGGAHYAVGDVIAPYMAPNQTAPSIQVTAVADGIVTRCAITNGGLFNALPQTGLITTHLSGSGNDALTVTLGVEEIALGWHAGLEQSWGRQTAYNSDNPEGVLTLMNAEANARDNKNLYVPVNGFLITRPNPSQMVLAAGTHIGIRTDTNGFGCARARALIPGTEHSALESFVNFNNGLSWGGTYETRGGDACTPLAIMGKLDSPRPSFVFVGDSITNGTVSLCVGCHGSSQDANGNNGWLEQAVAQSQPWTNFSRVGTTILDWLDPTLQPRMQETITMLHPSHVIDELGTNDQASDISYATFMARKQRLWSMLKKSGVGEIWITTITPNCASTYGIDATPTIVSGGSGYDAGATFNVELTGASCTIAPMVNVTSDPNGVVTQVNSYQVGACMTAPATPNAVSGGTGSGLLLGLEMAKAVNLANQKAGSSNGAIQTFNSNARANAYRVFGVTKTLDVARVVEQGTTGTWQPGMSKDCLHPSLAGHTAIASAMAGDFGHAVNPTPDGFVFPSAFAIK